VWRNPLSILCYTFNAVSPSKSFFKLAKYYRQEGEFFVPLKDEELAQDLMHGGQQLR